MWFYIGPRFNWGWPGNRVRSGQSNKNSLGLLLSSFLKSQNWPIFTIQSRSHVLALHMCRSGFHPIFYFRPSSCWPACVISASATQMSNSKLNANSDRKFRTYFYIAMQIFALQSSLFWYIGHVFRCIPEIYSQKYLNLQFTCCYLWFSFCIYLEDI